MRPHARQPALPSIRRRLRRGLVVAVLGAILAAVGAMGVPPVAAQKPGGGGGLSAPRPGSGPARPPVSQNTLVARGQAMNDTVLALVGDRRVTVTSFRVAWTGLRPPARPDSLTPKSAREFLELLIDKEAIGGRALRENLPWSRRDSLAFAGYVDQVTLRARLDPLLDGMAARLKAAGDTVPGRDALGVLVRDSVMSALHTRFDALVASRLALRWAMLPRPSSDSTIQAQIRVLGTLPQIEAADTGRTLAWSDAGTLKVSELLEHWKRTDPLHRPRVETASQIQDLGRNVLFERWLRASAADLKLAGRPDLAADIALRREFLAVNRLVAREVDAKLPADTASWRKWYQAHRDDYHLPGTAQILMLFLPGEASAATMYTVLMNPVQVESLIVQGGRGHVRYVFDVSEQGDSVLYRRALRAGTGAVLGPDSTSQGWRVARVQSFRPSRDRTFDEALMLVQHDLQQVEGERLMRQMIERTRRQTRIAVNEPAVRRLGQAGF